LLSNTPFSGEAALVGEPRAREGLCAADDNVYTLGEPIFGPAHLLNDPAGGDLGRLCSRAQGLPSDNVCGRVPI
jgi:hypothetical protein